MTAVVRITALVRRLVKWFYILFACAAICLAVVVQAGRSFSHLLADYPAEIGNYFSQRLHAQVTIGSLNAEWDGLKPTVDVNKLHIANQSGQQIFALEHAQLRLDLLSSLLHFRFVWSALTLDQAEMDFVQTEDGFWHVSGLPRTADNKDEANAQLDPLIDMSLLSRRIQFSKTTLGLHFASGDKTTLNSPLLRMENAGDFHRLALEIDVDNHPKTLTLIAEGHGDPRRRESFSSKAFVQLNQFPTNEPIAATTALLLHGINAEVHSEGTLSASLWFSSRPQHEGFDVAGKLDVQRLSLPVLERKLSLDSFSSELAGHWLYTGNWQIALQDVAANINQSRIEKVSVAASADSFSAPVVLRMQHLDLQGLHKTLDGAGVLGDGHLREVINLLSPQGELRNIQVAIPAKNPKDWELKANLSQVGVNAWQGVPALRKVDGYVQAGQKGGFVDIDSRQGFSMHYYPTYSAPMEFQQAKGQVAWHLQPENNQIYVNSGALEFSDGQEYAKGYMWLALPWTHNTGDIDLYLQIGARQLDASLYSKYTPAVIPHSLLEWLEKSIGPNNAGWVNEVGFLYRGTLNSHNHAARSHQLFVDMSHAQLQYHPEWPGLNEIDGRLLVSDDEVYATVDKAKLFGSDVGYTDIIVRPNPDGKGELLQVNGNVKGAASDGLRVLRESMLRRYIGANMDSWSLTGQMQTRVNITVPLASDGSGAAQQIDIDLDAPAFEMKNLKLAMQNITGHISFNQDSGLSSRDLQGRLFNEPVKALLSTKKQGDAGQTWIDVQGEVDGQQLAQWSHRPEALFLRGKIPYNTHIELNHHSVTEDAPANVQPFALVAVSSQLNGVTINLPQPYGKTAETERSLMFSMALYDQNSLIHIAYDDKLQALFELDPHRDNKLLRANIALDSEAKLTEKPEFLVSGKLPTLDIDPWRKIQQRYVDYSAQLAGNESDNSSDQNAAPDTIAGLPFRAAVQLAHYQVGPLPLDNIDIEAALVTDAWKIKFANPLVQGDAYLPGDKTKPMNINLHSLHLTSAILGAAAPDATKSTEAKPVNEADTIRGPSLDPRSLPLADISVDALFMDDKNYGNWSLQLRPNERGALFDNIQGSVRGVTIGGADDDKVGAKLEWTLGDNGANTHFIGSLSAANISDVLQQWQKPDTIESSNTRFRADISWAGDPQDFALKNLSGNMDIWLDKGRFKRNPSPGSDGFLRLMATLNFDSLARRLRLDFSDLYQSGLAYDQITGKVNFEPGTMTFTEPLLVKTPSSRLQLAGKLDLEHETMNTRLVATLPVVGNFTFFTALVTGLPAAAGIYLVSKLFKKQVDQATSISYSIRGDWDHPQMSFERLFESEESLINNAGKDDSDKKTNRSRAKGMLNRKPNSGIRQSTDKSGQALEPSP